MFSTLAAPRFGRPERQRAQRGEWWWSIPVTLETAAPWQPAVLERCGVQLEIPRGEGLPIRLRWHRGNTSESVGETTLAVGDRVRAAVAFWRADNGGATLASESLFRYGAPASTLEAGKSYTWRLLIRSHSKSWRSPYFVLQVPRRGEDTSAFVLSWLRGDGR